MADLTPWPKNAVPDLIKRTFFKTNGIPDVKYGGMAGPADSNFCFEIRAEENKMIGTFNNGYFATVAGMKYQKVPWLLSTDEYDGRGMRNLRKVSETQWMFGAGTDIRNEHGTCVSNDIFTLDELATKGGMFGGGGNMTVAFRCGPKSEETKYWFSQAEKGVCRSAAGPWFFVKELDDWYGGLNMFFSADLFSHMTMTIIVHHDHLHLS